MNEMEKMIWAAEFVRTYGRSRIITDARERADFMVKEFRRLKYFGPAKNCSDCLHSIRHAYGPTKRCMTCSHKETFDNWEPMKAEEEKQDD